ncbi:MULTISPECIES: NeuD/PglB/VioB family sugar acetyltransferase [Halomicrobium]|uniref:Hexapaptide repeat-containing transferase n=2 Tax=Halomicrobium mukohataei TaxID=57705 RepID=C7P3A5_HALMD|nr:MULTISPECIES: NeuD/PglB/VioB family sugar acetyltransferase [Halomicrobium]ACV47577.1 hexapaptide repeat-containing transferase [Halomicrobium mukohataei DSM 12286]QCD66040.1 hypothetical protein E5139_10450 [Halomicrobium mukohataei]QFR20845.1 hypothetical protein GBQ70_10445 [Halomicrobium sp. ZPS1]
MRAIYGAGEQGRVVLDILCSSDNTEGVVFLDDNTALHSDVIEEIPVVGDVTALSTFDEPVQCLVAYGDDQGVRLSIAEKISDHGYGFFSAAHPDSTISDTATLGDGVTVNARSYVGPDVSIEDHVLIDSCVNISHDSHLRCGATITPGATLAGGVEVGQDAYIGPGATVVEDVTIGHGAVIGAGSVVTESIEAGSTVVGVPAEPL